MRNLEDLYEIARVLGGIPILACAPGSPAHKAGIRYGDILVRMNGRDTRDLSGYIEAREIDGARVPVTIVRDGHELELVMELGAVVAAKSTAAAVLDHVVEERLFSLAKRPPRSVC